jgi:translation initiation factor 2 beta subunit (eIF-2beta)/eIF-5
MNKKDVYNMPNGYHDGWNSWNPHYVKCLECGSDNLEFFWDNGDVQAIRCLNCKVEEYGK